MKKKNDPVSNKKLEQYVNKNNWPTDIEEARKFALEAVSEWKFKDKQVKFTETINTTTDIKRLQEIVIYTMLSGEGLATIKI